MKKSALVFFSLLLFSWLCCKNPALVVKDEPIKPIPVAEKFDEKKVELGKMLYFEPRLSKSGWISCNSCHNLAMGGDDNMPTSIGHKWQLGPINAPTVLNAKYNLAQFWDGRAADLKEQAAGPIANPKEMSFTHNFAVEAVASIPEYVKLFEGVYGSDEVDLDRITDAIAAFEETLTTPNSPFDKWLKGDNAALSEAAVKGYTLFKDIGCIQCHAGIGVGGESFSKMGTYKPYDKDTENLGRYNVTGLEEDKYKFKVPLLRNIELTAPYFHDASAWSLEEAVAVMADYQFGKTLTAGEMNNMVAFLKSLTGKQPELIYPLLPPSSNDTPHPDRT